MVGGGSLDSEIRDELERELARLEGISTSLCRSLHAVVAHGWSQIKWPSRFSAVHLAALEGNVGALQLLARLGADLQTRDDWDLSPVDYAVQGGHQDVVAMLQNLVAPEVDKESLAKAMLPVPAADRSPSPAPASATAIIKEEDSKVGASTPPLLPSVLLENTNSSPVASSSLQSELCSENTQEQLCSQPPSSPPVPQRRPPSREVREGSVRPPVPDALEPEMRHICGLVAKYGWDKVVWKANFTALHQAAKFGSTLAVSYLLDSKAHAAIQLRDAAGWRPLDYAKRHRDIALLELLDPERYGIQSTALALSGGAESSKGTPQARDEFSLGIGELYAELRRVQAENKSLLQERERSWTKEMSPTSPDGPARRPLGSFPTQVKSVSLAGVLGEDDVRRYFADLEALGSDAVLHRLQEPVSSRGLGLCEIDAREALKQLELMARVCSRRASVKGSVARTELGEESTREATSHCMDDGRGQDASVASSDETRKPLVTPKVPMTAISWTRYLKGSHLQAGDTIWDVVGDDMDLVPTTELEERFQRRQTQHEQPPRSSETAETGLLEQKGDRDRENATEVKQNDLEPEMRRLYEAVLERGWHAIKWKAGFTGVHKAASFGSQAAVRLLLDARAHAALNMKDEAGMRPLDYAMSKGHLHLVALLEPEAEPECAAHARTDSEESLPDLRAELRRLKSEKAALLKEKEQRATGDNEPVRAKLTNALSEDEMRKCFRELQDRGSAAVLTHLKDPSGSALDDADAQQVLRQLELMARVCATSSERDASEGPSIEKPKDVETTTENKNESTNDGKGKVPAGKAGKGKGKSKEPSDLESVEDGKGKAPSGKGKGKGKAPPGKGGPPAPGGKGGPPAPGEKGASAAQKRATIGSVLELQKPKVTPRVPMKPIWWTRYLMGAQLQVGDTIWDVVNDDMDLVPKEELEERFGKKVKEQTLDMKVAEKKAAMQGEAEKQKQELKLLRIITEPQVVVGKEAALKKLHPAAIIARAILELNEQICNIDQLRCIVEHACPTQSQVEALVVGREANPTVPLALPEQYMWVISQIPAYRVRLDCWLFIRTYDDRRSHFVEGLRRFEEIANSCARCKAIASLLGIVLAFGNYLNGGTERGQADGFDLETLARLDSVKDPSGRDLRHLIFDVFFNKLKPKAIELIEGMQPVFNNVTRTLMKDSDGSEKLAKRVLVNLEDYDQCVTAMKEELQEREGAMHIVLQYADDSQDQFGVVMPGLFDKARSRIDELVELRDRAKESYAKLLRYLKVNAMKSSSFCLIWDDLFVPEALITKQSDKMKREVLTPCFCQGKALTLESFLVLWGFQEPVIAKIGEASGKRPSASSGRRSRTSVRSHCSKTSGKRGSVPAVPDHRSSDEGEKQDGQGRLHKSLSPSRRVSLSDGEPPSPKQDEVAAPGLAADVPDPSQADSVNVDIVAGTVSEATAASDQCAHVNVDIVAGTVSEVTAASEQCVHLDIVEDVVSEASCESEVF